MNARFIQTAILLVFLFCLAFNAKDVWAQSEPQQFSFSLSVCSGTSLRISDLPDVPSLRDFTVVNTGGTGLARLVQNEDGEMMLQAVSSGVFSVTLEGKDFEGNPVIIELRIEIIECVLGLGGAQAGKGDPNEPQALGNVGMECGETKTVRIWFRFDNVVGFNTFPMDILTVAGVDPDVAEVSSNRDTLQVTGTGKGTVELTLEVRALSLGAGPTSEVIKVSLGVTVTTDCPQDPEDEMPMGKGPDNPGNPAPPFEGIARVMPPCDAELVPVLVGSRSISYTASSVTNAGKDIAEFDQLNNLNLKEAVGALGDIDPDTFNPDSVPGFFEGLGPSLEVRVVVEGERTDRFSVSHSFAFKDFSFPSTSFLVIWSLTVNYYQCTADELIAPIATLTGPDEGDVGVDIGFVAGFTIPFPLSGPGLFSAKVDFGDGQNERLEGGFKFEPQGHTTVTHHYAQADTYTLTLTVEDFAGRVATDTHTIRIVARPPEVGISGPTLGLPGESLRFFSEAHARGNSGDGQDNTISSLIIDYGDGTRLIPTFGADRHVLLMPSHAYAEPGYYTITLTATDALGASTEASHGVFIMRPKVTFSDPAGDCTKKLLGRLKTCWGGDIAKVDADVSILSRHPELLKSLTPLPTQPEDGEKRRSAQAEPVRLKTFQDGATENTGELIFEMTLAEPVPNTFPKDSFFSTYEFFIDADGNPNTGFQEQLFPNFGRDFDIGVTNWGSESSIHNGNDLAPQVDIWAPDKSGGDPFNPEAFEVRLDLASFTLSENRTRITVTVDAVALLEALQAVGGVQFDVQRFQVMAWTRQNTVNNDLGVIDVVPDERYVPVPPRTLRVPEQFPTLEAATRAANPGDIVEVDPGVYRGDLFIETEMVLKAAQPGTAIIEGTDEFGILIARTQDVVVEGFTIKGPIDGVRISAPGVTLRDNTVQQSPRFGIVMQSSTNVTIEGNRVSDSGRQGIFALGANETFIQNNTVSNAGAAGISIQRGTASVRGNTISGTRPEANGSLGIGVFVLEDAKVTVADNQLRDNAHGVWVFDASAQIQNNTVERNRELGILLQDASNVTVSNNMITDHGGQAILVIDSSGITLADNSIRNNRVFGIDLRASTVTVRGNTISGTRQDNDGFWGVGIVVWAGASATITDNTIRDNEGDGIWIGEKARVQVRDNTIRNHPFCGVYAEDSQVSGGGNTLSNNEGGNTCGVAPRTL